MKIKKTIVKIDEIRENIEDFIVSNVLQRWDNFKKADDVRVAVNLAVINFALAYAQSHGLPAEQVPQEVREKVAKSGAKIGKKLNNKLQKQLNKKSKIYVKNKINESKRNSTKSQ